MKLSEIKLRFDAIIADLTNQVAGEEDKDPEITLVVAAFRDGGVDTYYSDDLVGGGKETRLKRMGAASAISQIVGQSLFPPMQQQAGGFLMPLSELLGALAGQEGEDDHPTEH